MLENNAGETGGINAAELFLERPNASNSRSASHEGNNRVHEASPRRQSHTRMVFLIDSLLVVGKGGGKYHEKRIALSEALFAGRHADVLSSLGHVSTRSRGGERNQINIRPAACCR